MGIGAPHYMGVMHTVYHSADVCDQISRNLLSTQDLVISRITIHHDQVVQQFVAVKKYRDETGIAHFISLSWRHDNVEALISA